MLTHLKFRSKRGGPVSVPGSIEMGTGRIGRETSTQIRSSNGAVNTASSSRTRMRVIASGAAMVVLLLGAVVGPHTWRQEQSTSADSAWDVVVLGRIDFC